MVRFLIRAGVTIVLASWVLAAGALAYRAWRQHETAQFLAIDTNRGIREASFVQLGGIDQWVQVRGEDRNNPVLLILAGGPGNSLVPLTPVFRPWEKVFTLVQWDQRGAGKTYGHSGSHEAPMTIDHMVDDGLELTQYLLEHLHVPKIILVGHSWGTVLGVRMIKARPDMFAEAERNLEATLRPVALFAPEFSLGDIYSMLQGSKLAGNATYRETLTYDARNLGLRFDVPFFIFNGDKDLVTPIDLAKAYFDTIAAPQKDFVVLDGGGHSALLTMPDRFLSELVARVRPLAAAH